MSTNVYHLKYQGNDVRGTATFSSYRAARAFVKRIEPDIRSYKLREDGPHGRVQDAARLDYDGSWYSTV